MAGVLGNAGNAYTDDLAPTSTGDIWSNLPSIISAATSGATNIIEGSAMSGAEVAQVQTAAATPVAPQSNGLLVFVLIAIGIVLLARSGDL
jgi:hypothetical protein